MTPPPLRVRSFLRGVSKPSIRSEQESKVSSEMFNELGWSTIENPHNYNKAVLTYKALNDLKPQSHIHGFGPGRATVHPDLASR